MPATLDVRLAKAAARLPDPRNQLAHYLRRRNATAAEALADLMLDIVEAAPTETLAQAIEARVSTLPALEREFVSIAQRWAEERLRPLLADALESGDSAMERSSLPTLERVQKQLDPEQGAAQRWVAEREAALAEYFGKTAAANLRRLLQRGIAEHQFAAGGVARDLRWTLGLSERDANVLMRRYVAQLHDEDAPAAQASRNLRKGVEQKMRARTNDAIQHELADAWNQGALLSVQHRVKEGELPLDLVKVWLTERDDRVCPTCAPLDGEVRDLDKPFSNGRQAPSAHFKCRCAVAFRRRDDERWSAPRGDTQAGRIWNKAGEWLDRGGDLMERISALAEEHPMGFAFAVDLAIEAVVFPLAMRSKHFWRGMGRAETALRAEWAAITGGESPSKAAWHRAQMRAAGLSSDGPTSTLDERLEAAARLVRERSQEVLRKEGALRPDGTVRLWRAERLPSDVKQAPAWARKGNQVDLETGDGVTRWTTDQELATASAMEAGAGAVLYVDVPLERVLSVHRWTVTGRRPALEVSAGGPLRATVWQTPGMDDIVRPMFDNPHGFFLDKDELRAMDGLSSGQGISALNVMGMKDARREEVARELAMDWGIDAAQRLFDEAEAAGVLQSLFLPGVNLAELRSSPQRLFFNLVDGLETGWEGSPTNARSIFLQRAIHRELGASNSAAVSDFEDFAFGSIEAAMPDGYRAAMERFWQNGGARFYQNYVQHTYRRTQRELQDLRDSGQTHVTLLRGVTLTPGRLGSDFKHVPDWLKQPESGPHVLGLRPVSSWTTDPDVALRFAASVDGYVWATRVPLEDVFSFYGTGPGMSTEHEVLLLGKENARIVSKSFADALPEDPGWVDESELGLRDAIDPQSIVQRLFSAFPAGGAAAQNLRAVAAEPLQPASTGRYLRQVFGNEVPPHQPGQFRLDMSHADNWRMASSHQDPMVARTVDRLLDEEGGAEALVEYATDKGVWAGGGAPRSDKLAAMISDALKKEGIDVSTQENARKILATRDVMEVWFRSHRGAFEDEIGDAFQAALAGSGFAAELPNLDIVAGIMARRTLTEDVLVESMPGEDELRNLTDQLMRQLREIWILSPQFTDAQAFMLAARDELGDVVAGGMVMPPDITSGAFGGRGAAEALYRRHGKVFRAMARAHYEEVQEWLRNEGIDGLTLYRGLFGDLTDVKPAGGAGRIELEAGPLSSWSASRRIAEAFAARSAPTGDDAVMLAAHVPAERIFSLPGVGFFGEPNQAEVLVLGGRIRPFAADVSGASMAGPAEVGRRWMQDAVDADELDDVLPLHPPPRWGRDVAEGEFGEPKHYTLEPEETEVLRELSADYARGGPGETMIDGPLRTVNTYLQEVAGKYGRREAGTKVHLLSQETEWGPHYNATRDQVHISRYGTAALAKWLVLGHRDEVALYGLHAAHHELAHASMPFWGLRRPYSDNWDPNWDDDYYVRHRRLYSLLEEGLVEARARAMTGQAWRDSVGSEVPDELAARILDARDREVNVMRVLVKEFGHGELRKAWDVSGEGQRALPEHFSFKGRQLLERWFDRYGVDRKVRKRFFDIVADPHFKAATVKTPVGDVRIPYEGINEMWMDEDFVEILLRLDPDTPQDFISQEDFGKILAGAFSRRGEGQQQEIMRLIGGRSLTDEIGDVFRPPDVTPPRLDDDGDIIEGLASPADRKRYHLLRAEPEGTTGWDFRFRTPAGELEVRAKYNLRAGTIVVDDVRLMVDDPTFKLGNEGVRAVMEQVVEHFPGAKRIAGLRATGTRAATGGAATTVDLPEALQEVAGKALTVRIAGDTERYSPLRRPDLSQRYHVEALSSATASRAPGRTIAFRVGEDRFEGRLVDDGRRSTSARLTGLRHVDGDRTFDEALHELTVEGGAMDALFQQIQDLAGLPELVRLELPGVARVAGQPGPRRVFEREVPEWRRPREGELPGEAREADVESLRRLAETPVVAGGEPINLYETDTVTPISLPGERPSLIRKIKGDTSAYNEELASRLAGVFGVDDHVPTAAAVHHMGLVDEDSGATDMIGVSYQDLIDLAPLDPASHLSAQLEEAVANDAGGALAIRLFEFAIGAADRHAGNYVVDTGGKLWGVDYEFSLEPDIWIQESTFDHLIRHEELTAELLEPFVRNRAAAMNMAHESHALDLDVRRMGIRLDIIESAYRKVAAGEPMTWSDLNDLAKRADRANREAEGAWQHWREVKPDIDDLEGRARRSIADLEAAYNDGDVDIMRGATQRLDDTRAVKLWERASSNFGGVVNERVAARLGKMLWPARPPAPPGDAAPYEFVQYHDGFDRMVPVRQGMALTADWINGRTLGEVVAEVGTDSQMLSSERLAAIRQHDPSLADVLERDAGRVRLFEYLIGAGDRHSANYMVGRREGDTTTYLYGIDYEIGAGGPVYPLEDSYLHSVMGVENIIVSREDIAHIVAMGEHIVREAQMLGGSSYAVRDMEARIRLLRRWSAVNPETRSGGQARGVTWKDLKLELSYDATQGPNLREHSEAHPFRRYLWEGDRDIDRAVERREAEVDALPEVLSRAEMGGAMGGTRKPAGWVERNPLQAVANQARRDWRNDPRVGQDSDLVEHMAWRWGRMLRDDPDLERLPMENVVEQLQMELHMEEALAREIAEDLVPKLEAAAAQPMRPPLFWKVAEESYEVSGVEAPLMEQIVSELAADLGVEDMVVPARYINRPGHDRLVVYRGLPDALTLTELRHQAVSTGIADHRDGGFEMVRKILQHVNPEEPERLVMFNYLIGNVDLHGGNFMIEVEGGQAALSAASAGLGPIPPMKLYGIDFERSFVNGSPLVHDQDILLRSNGVKSFKVEHVENALSVWPRLMLRLEPPVLNDESYEAAQARFVVLHRWLKNGRRDGDRLTLKGLEDTARDVYRQFDWRQGRTPLYNQWLSEMEVDLGLREHAEKVVDVQIEALRAAADTPAVHAVTGMLAAGRGGPRIVRLQHRDPVFVKRVWAFEDRLMPADEVAGRIAAAVPALKDLAPPATVVQVGNMNAHVLVAERVEGELLEDVAAREGKDMIEFLRYRPDFDQLVLFDYLMAGSDRHGGNFLVTAEGRRIVGVDWEGDLTPEVQLQPGGILGAGKGDWGDDENAIEDAVDGWLHPDLAEQWNRDIYLREVVRHRDDIIQAARDAGAPQEAVEGLVKRLEVLERLLEHAEGPGRGRWTFGDLLRISKEAAT